MALSREILASLAAAMSCWARTWNSLLTCPIKEISASTGSIEVRGGKICISIFQSGKKQTAESTIWREECWLKTWPRSSLKNLKAWRATLEGSISWLSRSFQNEFGMLRMLRMLQQFPGGSSQSRILKYIEIGAARAARVSVQDGGFPWTQAGW